MTPAETAIREALAAGPTPQGWRAFGNVVYGDIHGRAHRIATIEDWSEGTELLARLIAACNPAALAELLAELDRLRAALEVSEAASKAAVSKAQWRAVTNRELNQLRDELTREQARSQMYADLVRGVAVVLHGPGYSDTSKLPAEVEALKADAERYRWLLRNYLSFDACAQAIKHGSLDAAIDAAKGGA